MRTRPRSALKLCVYCIKWKNKRPHSTLGENRIEDTSEDVFSTPLYRQNFLEFRASSLRKAGVLTWRPHFTRALPCTKPGVFRAQ